MSRPPSLTVVVLLYLLLLSGLSAAAQVVIPYRVPQAAIGTVGLHSKSAPPPAVVLDKDDGLYDVITAEKYRAIGHGGPLIICEELPTYRARNRKGNLALFIQQNLRWPHTREDAEGRILVSFIVGPDG